MLISHTFSPFICIAPSFRCIFIQRSFYSKFSKWINNWLSCNLNCFSIHKLKIVRLSLSRRCALYKGIWSIAYWPGVRSGLVLSALDWESRRSVLKYWPSGHTFQLRAPACLLSMGLMCIRQTMKRHEIKPQKYLNKKSKGRKWIWQKNQKAQRQKLQRQKNKTAENGRSCNSLTNGTMFFDSMHTQYFTHIFRRQNGLNSITIINPLIYIYFILIEIL